MSYYWKLKFYLARGSHYRCWQIRGNNKEELYFNPDKYSLILTDCLLTNKINVAQKTFNGANRQPCAWVKCSKYCEVRPIEDLDRYQQIHYNPKVAPYWRDGRGNNIDSHKYTSVITAGSKIYAESQIEVQISLF